MERKLAKLLYHRERGRWRKDENYVAMKYKGWRRNGEKRRKEMKIGRNLTLRLLISYINIYIYIYGAPILDVSRSHTTTQHSR